MIWGKRCIYDKIGCSWILRISPTDLVETATESWSKRFRFGEEKYCLCLWCRTLAATWTDNCGWICMRILRLAFVLNSFSTFYGLLFFMFCMRIIIHIEISLCSRIRSARSQFMWFIEFNGRTVKWVHILQSLVRYCVTATEWVSKRKKKNKIEMFVHSISINSIVCCTSAMLNCW